MSDGNNMNHENTNSFRFPRPSRSTRHISPRSRASLRGALVAQLPADRHPRRIVFESKLEQRVLHLLLARPDIRDIWDQPPSITYRAEDGRDKRHVFDYLATFISGRRIAIVVKPAQRASRPSFQNEFQLIRASTNVAFAHDVILVTDQSFNPAAARNAARLHEFRRFADPEADICIRNLIATFTGETTIAEVVSNSGLGGRGFRAVFRAIYAGIVQALDEGDIGATTRIVRGIAQ